MAVVSGVTGDVAVSTTHTIVAVNAYEWTMDITNDLFTFSPFGATGGKSTRKGLYLLTGVVKGFVDDATNILDADILPDATVSAFILTSVTGTTYTFNAHIGVISQRVGIDGGPGNLDFNFTSDGNVTIAA